MVNRIFILSELYYPAETGTGFMMGKLAEGLASQSPIHVICGYSAEALVANLPRRESRGNITVERCSGTRLNKNVVWLRTLNLVTISLSIFLTALRRIRKGDRVLVVTNPPSLPFFALVACKIRQAKCYLLLYDLYPEVLVATGLVHPDAIAARLLGFLNYWLYNHMETIIVLGRDMYRIVERRMNRRNPSIVMIPNWADIEEITPQPRHGNALLERLGLSDKFVILYAGNMGRTHGLEMLLETARRVQRTADIHFLFVGTGAKRDWLAENVRAFGLNNVTVLPLQPRRDLSTVLNACDIAVISFIPGMAGISVPSRMYSTLAAGKPVLAVADGESELAMVVREESIGWIVKPDDPAKTVEAIMNAWSNRQSLPAMSLRARNVAQEKYSFERVLQLYARLLLNPATST